MIGTVVRSVGSSYRIRTEDGGFIDAVLRGKLRLEGLKTTNPVAVGDHVRVVEEAGGQPAIAEILPRANHILRKATKAGSQVQRLCANVDQGVIVCTIAQPFTPLGYIDRFLVMCEAYHVPAVVVFNKIDLLKTEAEEDRLDDFIVTYEEAGYTVLQIAATDARYRPQAVDLFAGKVSFVAGPSGAGKSTLINLADPSLSLRTAALAKHSDKGRHTTTHAEMFELATGGYVIDAPGFREFDIVGLAKAEVWHYFPEMRKRANQCRFHNCLHISEPDCAVRAAVEEGDIAQTRYHTYLGMLESIE